MAIESYKAIRSIQSQYKAICSARVSAGKTPEYNTPREAMLQLHLEWQALISAVRQSNIGGPAADAAMKLAAAAMKFVTDLKDPNWTEEDLPRKRRKKRLD